MAQASVTHVMIIKVDFEGDVRRISMELPEDASRAQIFQAIRTAVAQGFDIDQPVVGASFPVLKYRDEEGDLCTLVEASVDDMLEFSKCGTLRLFMSKTHAVIVEAIVKDKMPHEMPQLTSVAEIAADIALAASTKEDAVAADVAAAAEDSTVEGAQEEAAAEEVTAVKAEEGQASSQEGAAAEDVVAEDPAAEEAATTAEGSGDLGRLLTAKASCLRRLQLLEESATENAVAVAAVAEGAPTVEATAEEPGSEQPNELDNTPEGDAEPAEPHHEEDPEMSCGEHARALNELKTMGFSEEEAQQALEDAHGNLQLAVEHLINQKPHFETEATMFKKIEVNLRGLPSNVMEQLQILRGQLREMLSNVKQQQTQFQDRMGNGEFEHLQRLQATLEQMKARLNEVKQLVQAGVKKTKGSQPDAQEEEALRKAETQLADAQHFVAETLASLHARGSEVIKCATAKYSRKNDPEDEDGDAVATETMDAAASAAVDAVEVALASVDDFLSADPSTGSADHSAPAEHTSAPKLDVKNATQMDHAQVLLSKSMGGLRSLASGLFKSDRVDPWLTAPSTAAASDDTAAAATNDAAIAAVVALAAAHNVTVAEAMSVAQSENVQAIQADTSLSVDPSEAPAVGCQITGVMTTK